MSLLPLGDSQGFTPISSWSEFGRKESPLSKPEAIAVHPSGNVYVADTANNMIKIFSNNGTFITEWGTFGTPNGSLSYPQGIAIDPASGNVYVADTANNRIQVFSNNGTFIAKWGEYGSHEEGMRSPADIAIHMTGNAYVADTDNNRVLVFPFDLLAHNTASFSEEEADSNDITNNTSTPTN